MRLQDLRGIQPHRCGAKPHRYRQVLRLAQLLRGNASPLRGCHSALRRVASLSALFRLLQVPAWRLEQKAARDDVLTYKTSLKADKEVGG